MDGALIVFTFAALGCRLRLDVENLTEIGLGCIRTIKEPPHRRILKFLALPGDGILYLLLVCFSWVVRRFVLAELVAKNTIDKAKSMSMEWDQTESALRVNIGAALGVSSSDINESIVVKARRRFEGMSR